MTTSSESASVEEILVRLKAWHRDIQKSLKRIEEVSARVDKLEKVIFGREVARR